jgi:hypothetical protein
MVTIPLQEEKKQKNLLYVFLFLVLVILVIYFRGKIFDLIKIKKPPILYTDVILEKIVINFEIFQNPLFQELQPFERLPEFEGTAGRENPFSPISTSSKP